MAYSQKQWDLVRSYFEAGLSLSEITSRDDVEIKSKSQISKKANLWGWDKGKNERLIEKKVEIKQQVEMVKREQSLLKETDVRIIERLTMERSELAEYFQSSAIMGQQLANATLEHVSTKFNDASDEEKTEMTARAIVVSKEHATITSKNRESVMSGYSDIDGDTDSTQTVKPFSGLYGVIESKP